jgi:hypothetical protein
MDTEMKWQPAFSDAIANKKTLEILYSDRVWRTIEPHTYGINNAGNYAVSAYRTKKERFPNEKPDWRMYLSSEIIEIRETGSTFNGPRSGYSPTPKTFSRVISKL